MISIIATCPEETKDILEAELEDLGAQNIAQTYRAVTCDVNEQQFYEAHLKLRTASRILKVIKSFSSKHENMLFSQAKRIKWDELFSPNQTFIVEATTSERGSEFMTGNTISKRVREGIQDVFTHRLNTVPKVDLKNPGVIVVAFQREGRCMISIDTCGKALHKRGYKTGLHPAPLKETLASAILRYAGYQGDEPLWDPMCGSGTLVIEAAYIALNKAP
jgi:putative N6-adenine-specific DNA methylase